MKNLFAAFVIILSSGFIARAQETEPAKSEKSVYDIVEEVAEFPGGQDGLAKFLSQNVQYPQEALEMGIGGKCYAKFVISETGQVSNVTIIKGVPDCPECDAEVIRVLKLMPKWTPAKNDGQPVNSYYNLPVNFKLVGGSKDKTKKQLRRERRARRKNGDF